MFRFWKLLQTFVIVCWLAGTCYSQQQYYQPVRSTPMRQAPAAQFPSPQQQQMASIVERRAMQDVQREMINDKWQQIRNESSARLAARYNAPPPMARYAAQNRVPYQAPIQTGYASQQYTSQQYPDQRFARRMPPNYMRSPQSASQDDPFGEIRNDPFGDQPQDPFGEPPAETPPQQPDPFDRPQQRDPFGEMPQNNQFDPFAEPPTGDVTNQTPESDAQNPDRQPIQPTDPRLPGGIQEVPEVPRDSQELPVPPRQVFPPQEDMGNRQQQDPAGVEEPRIDPVTPPPAPKPNDARPISPGDQLYPGQIAPEPFTQGPAGPDPTPYAQPYAGSPSPYMPAYPAYGQPAPSYGPAPGYAPGTYGAPPIAGSETIPGYPPVVQSPGYSVPTNQIYPGQLPSVVEGNNAMPSMIDGCSTCTAFEECTPQFYLSLFGGIEDIGSLTTIGQSGAQTGELFFDKGRGYGIALGALQGYNLRTDFEFTYRKSELSNVVGNLPFFQNGEIESYTGMANMYWEFMSFPNCCWKPYIGAGLGFGVFDNTSDNGNDHDSAFAYQYIAGMNYKYSEMMDLFGEYRMLRADDLDFTGTELDFESDNFFVGLRLKF